VEGRTIAVETNSQGMRWRETEVAKPKGVRRIAVLGDSFAFGCWSRSIETSFVGLLDQKLSPGAEVLNFGVGGYGFEDELLLLREKVLDFAPDEILIATFNGNDIRDSFLDTTRYVVKDGAAELADDALEGKVPPVYRKAPYVNPSPVPPTGVLGWWWRSAFVRLALRTADRDPPYLNYEVSQRFTSYSFWSQSPYPAVAVEALSRSLALLGEMRRTAEEGGARLSMVAIPTAEQVYAIHPAGPGFDISLPQALLGKWAAEQGVPFLDLLPRLREATRATGRRPYLRYDVHLNDFGHEIAGEAIAAWMAGR
jgi:lysophospholipase L1-like esterase